MAVQPARRPSAQHPANISRRPRPAKAPALRELTYASQAEASLSPRLMERTEPMPHEEGDGTAADLARRLARYRRRVEAEGRPRSLRLIDRAIEDTGSKADGAA